MLQKIRNQIKKNSTEVIAFILGFSLSALIFGGFGYSLMLSAKKYFASSVQGAITTDDKQDNNFKYIQSHFESLLKVASFPIQKADVKLPEISAKAAFIIDFNKGRVLFEKNPDTKLPIGSLTKLASAIVAVENFDLKTFVKLTKADVTFKGSMLRFMENEEYSIESLLKFALIESNNNAIYAIANLMGIDIFTEKMNHLAKTIGLNNTHFQNPAGLDHENNYSTAKDISTLLGYINKFPLIKEILTQKSAQIFSSAKRKIKIVSTNQLIDDPHIIAAKTGTTEKAGQNFAAFIKIFNQNEFVLVILGSQDRYKDTQNLIKWLEEGFIWENNL